MRGMTFDTYFKRISSLALRAVAAHWHEARGASAMPGWDDIRPARIAAHLTIVWAFRFDADTREFTARLAGERIARGFNRNFRGLPLADLHPPEFYPATYANGLRLVEGPCMAHVNGRLFRCQGRIGSGERISLPLSSDGVQCDGVLGASDYNFQLLSGEDHKVELLFEDERYFPLHLFECPVA
jgi:hypothetical protein